MINEYDYDYHYDSHSDTSYFNLLIRKLLLLELLLKAKIYNSSCISFVTINAIPIYNKFTQGSSRQCRFSEVDQIV